MPAAGPGCTGAAAHLTVTLQLKTGRARLGGRFFRFKWPGGISVRRTGSHIAKFSQILILVMQYNQLFLKDYFLYLCS